MIKSWIPILAAALVLPAIPAAAQSRAERQMMADIRMLQEQAQQLAITLASLQDSLKSLNSRLDESDEATRKGLADQRLVVENMGADLRVIRDRTGETNVRINTVGLSPTRMYEAAMAEYAAGQWTLAITGFDQFLKAFPTSEMADDAQKMIGDTHYAAGKYPEAI